MNYINAPQNNNETSQTGTGNQSFPPRQNRRLGCFGIVGLIAVAGGLFFAAVFIIILSFVFLSTGELGEGSRQIVEEELRMQRGVRDKIVVIDIKGIIHSSSGLDGASTGKVTNQLNQARRDPAVRAVILDMNTPGGEVTASDEVSYAVRNLRDADIPVVVCMRSVCASGGYYIAAAADHIVANPTTLTGSIGVLIPRFNYSQLLDKIGVQHESFTSGEMKNMLSGAVKRSPEKKQRQNRFIQKLVDKTFRKFLEVVAEGRENFDSLAEVKKADFADGRIMLAEEAVDFGLVDSIGYFDDAIYEARELSSAYEANVVRYKSAFRLTDLLSPLTSRREVNINSELLPIEVRLSPYNLYYLMPTVADN